MPTTVEIKGIMEDKIQLLIDAGLYASKSEFVRDGVRRLLEEQDFLEIAKSLYKSEIISLGKAAEIANMTIELFVEECIKSGIEIKISPKEKDEIIKDINVL